MKIRAMIAEDERLAREELAYLVGLHDDFVLCPSAEDGEQLLKLVDKYYPDVLFLDIQMPGMTGLAIAEQLQKDYRASTDHKPLVVFTTAYDAYALDAFAIDALDYLLKPYDTERLEVTLARIRDRMRRGGAQTHSNVQGPQYANDEGALSQSPSAKIAAKILVDSGDKVAVVAPETILYALRRERHVDIHTVRGVLKFRGTLTELEEKLKGGSFFRTHRGCLVNLEAIREITPWFNGAHTVIIENNERTRIPVSRSAAKSLFQRLSSN